VASIVGCRCSRGSATVSCFVVGGWIGMRFDLLGPFVRSSRSRVFRRSLLPRSGLRSQSNPSVLFSIPRFLSFVPSRGLSRLFYGLCFVGFWDRSSPSIVCLRGLLGAWATTFAFVPDCSFCPDPVCYGLCFVGFWIPIVSLPRSSSFVRSRGSFSCLLRYRASSVFLDRQVSSIVRCLRSFSFPVWTTVFGLRVPGVLYGMVLRRLSVRNPFGTSISLVLSRGCFSLVFLRYRAS
jgi:hypothetical protein